VLALVCASATAADNEHASTLLHALTSAYAEPVERSAPALRACLPAQAVFAWTTANAAVLDALHDVRAARALWRVSAAIAAPRWPLHQVRALNASARLGLAGGDFDAARHDAQTALALARTYRDIAGEAEAAFHLASVLRLRGEVIEALRVAQESNALSQQVGDVPGSARALTLMATIAKNRGEYIQGLEYEIQALRMEPAGSDVQAQAITLSKLGKLYEQIEDNAQALDYADRALRLADGGANRETLAHILVGYANTLNDLSPEQHERALGYADRALGYAIESGHRTLEVDAALQVARAQFNAEALSSAAESFEHALHVARDIGQKPSIAHILLRQGELFEHLGRLADALDNTRASIEIYRASDNLPRLIKAYAILERQLDASGAHAAAQTARLQRFEWRDRVLGASAMRNLAQIEASRLREAQQQEIELLRRQAEIDTLRLERGGLLRWLEALLAALLGIALALVARRFRRSQRLNRVLHGKNQEILAHQQALESANAELQHSAQSLYAALSTDALTGAFSRKHGLQLLADGIAHAGERHTDEHRSDEHRVNEPPLDEAEYGVLLIDIDHFKQVNDRYGHLQGDRVLAGIAEQLRLRLRTGDALVRFGGEEFLVLLPRTPLPAALALAQDLRCHIEGLPRNTLPPLHVTISIGVCALAQLERRCMEALIEAADDALYLAKNAGRNRVVAYGQDDAVLPSVS
jgi:diguanylate cyclase (GGDEF)-like protein